VTTSRSLSAEARRAQASWRLFRTSKTWQNGVRYTTSYILLLIGSAFMLFPMLWMFSSSLKPAWQIFTDPPLWIPQRWEQVQGGKTNRQLDLWQIVGDERKVIKIGTRRYTTVFDPARLTNLQSVPADQIGPAVTTSVSDTLVNVRPWTVDGQTKQVVALTKSGDQMVVVELRDIETAIARLPLDSVNSGKRATTTVSGIEFRGREITVNDQTRQVVAIGPESELTIVGASDIAAQAVLAPAQSLSEAGFANVGQTELPLFKRQDDASGTSYVRLTQESWQPIINDEDLNQARFIAPAAQLGARENRPVQGIEMQVAQFTPTDGAPYDVVILISGTDASLVMPVTQAKSLRLAQFGGLANARGDSVGAIAFRVQDGFAEGDAVHSVALVGEPRDMALIVPQAVVKDAFDVSPDRLKAATHTEFNFDGYRQALQTKVANTYFPTFFKNSFLLVALNTIGHLISCVVVAYAFARLRAPGKGFLFLVLLSTMMLPYPVTLVPVYELFRDLNAVNTLWPLFIRSFFGNAFLIFMLRQFFSSIPRELEEAARIDGATVLQILWHVIVPLSKPAIATVAIFTFWWTWNSFLEPFIYLTSPELFPVSVGLNFFKDQYGGIFYDRLIAASVMSMIPMLLIFFFAQRYFIEGIQLQGLKG
jgi:ABC-type glycerol-3-phosphate transport system permease component